MANKRRIGIFDEEIEEYNYLNYFRNTGGCMLNLRFWEYWKHFIGPTILKSGRGNQVGNHHKPFCSIKLRVSKALPSNVHVQKELQ